MIDKDKLKIFTYNDLKPFLPKEHKLHTLYEKAKDKSKFDVFFVHEGDIETDVLDVSDDIGWATYYKFVDKQNVNSFFGPILLGNINCKVLSCTRGVILGNVKTKNMCFMYSDVANSFLDITGNLNVEEVLFATGKGLWGKKYHFKIGKKALIHTMINVEQAVINCNELVVHKTFHFPQTDAADGTRYTNWARHSLNELIAYFNTDHLKLEQYGNNVSFFFQEPTKLDKAYFNYLNNNDLINVSY